MRPDVAVAFDRMEAAARRDGVTLLITSGYRSDAEQAELYKRHPDPKWVAPPGHSLHRYGTELDLGPPFAYGWLQRNARRFHFIQRYSWEPWHWGYGLNPRSAPPVAGGERAVPSFVPALYVEPIARAASRWNVAAALLAAQLYAESNFNPFAVSRAGARGIGVHAWYRASYGLGNPFDAPASIDAQAHRCGICCWSSARCRSPSPPTTPDHRRSACGCVPGYPETQAYVAHILGPMGGALALPPDVSFEVRLVN